MPGKRRIAVQSINASEVYYFRVGKSTHPSVYLTFVRSCVSCRHSTYAFMQYLIIVRTLTERRRQSVPGRPTINNKINRITTHTHVVRIRAALRTAQHPTSSSIHLADAVPEALCGTCAFSSPFSLLLIIVYHIAACTMQPNLRSAPRRTIDLIFKSAKPLTKFYCHTFNIYLMVWARRHFV